MWSVHADETCLSKAALHTADVDYPEAEIDSYLDGFKKKQRPSEFDKQGWIIDKSANLQLSQSGTYDLTLALHGSIATMYVNQGKSSTFVFGEALNEGLLGLGGLGAKAHFDNFQVQTLPPVISEEITDAFDLNMGG